MERGREMEMISNMASCLILLSNSTSNQNDIGKRVFTCKTCSKVFPSFQALGGHRASHRRSAVVDGEAPPWPRRLKQAKHDCPICGAEFAVGQALGGHMRKHKGGAHAADAGGGGVGQRSCEEAEVLRASPVTMKKSGGGSGKRVLCLDLNLTPLENEDLKLELGRMAL
ncbi:PREDICTED: zinc finger protein ZAT12-like [Tarenaya hassleriana]|uniref:zinc finger protein ZAT12-like n=1 Tax=Tarenaya hassleriana TaxID=28532 RepID=UPI00053C0806|nr:PREDICTED: zinc finger protein ZAT12-like [Tarenaya hassleriana]